MEYRVLLQSMTGFGEAHSRQDGLSVAVEIRAINNRFLKLSTRTTEGYASLEPLIEGEIRGAVHRGTVQVNVRIERRRSPDDFHINVDVLDRYRRQLMELQNQWEKGEHRHAPLESLLMLPGVVDDASGAAVDAAADWPVVQKTLRAAMENMGRMRAEEGRAMAADLASNCRTAADWLERIERRVPPIVEEYRAKLFERLKRTLAQMDVSLNPGDVIREVSLYADRSDVSEEIVRLRSHLEQFQTTMQLPESSGRKLDFLTQEMFREANTIGSKISDVEVARWVIEIKTAIERIREMIQNVE